jgi:hypothetical protein
VLHLVSCADMPSPIPRQDSPEYVVHTAFRATAAFPKQMVGQLLQLLISRPARCSLTLRPACSPIALLRLLHRKLRQLHCFHCRSDCYRLERPFAGRVYLPLKTSAFSRRTFYFQRATKVNSSNFSPVRRPLDKYNRADSIVQAGEFQKIMIRHLEDIHCRL